jgi:hypothetical protein
MQLLTPGEHFIVQCTKSTIDCFITPSWSFLSCCGLLKQSEKIPTSLTEEEKIPLNNRLPGNGRHSVLVIKKKSYEKLILHDERVKKEGLNKTICCPPATGKMEIKWQNDFGHSMQFFRQRTIAHSAQKHHFRKFDNHIQNANIIRFHRGDNADDFNFDDCD